MIMGVLCYLGMHWIITIVWFPKQNELQKVDFAYSFMGWYE
jgi:hypothetical protein